MDTSRVSLQDLSEAIQLASQVDAAATNQDEADKQFEDLLSQLKLTNRLILEADAQKRKLAHYLKDKQQIGNPTELVEKTVHETLKSDENLQIHTVCQTGLDVCEYSNALRLGPPENENQMDVNNDYEFVELSVEFIDICSKIQADSNALRYYENGLQSSQNKIKQVKAEISERKANPEADSGPASERIQKLRTLLDKFCGKYDFTRYLTQLLLMGSEEDLNNPKIADLFLECGDDVN